MSTAVIRIDSKLKKIISKMAKKEKRKESVVANRMIETGIKHDKGLK